MCSLVVFSSMHDKCDLRMTVIAGCPVYIALVVHRL